MRPQERFAQEIHSCDYRSYLSKRTVDWLEKNNIKTLADLLVFDWGSSEWRALKNFGFVSQLEVMRFISFEVVKAVEDLEKEWNEPDAFGEPRL